MIGSDNEPVTLNRDLEAVIVPDGFTVTLEKDSLVYITQAMGGCFTLYFEGQLFRVGGLDADALGKEPIKPPDLPDSATEEEFELLAWDQMKTVYDPEIPINIVDLGLIYRCDVTTMPNGERSVSVDLTLTAPGCGMGPMLVQDAQEKIAIVPTVADVRVDLVFDPPWNQSMMSDEARLQTGMM